MCIWVDLRAQPHPGRPGVSTVGTACLECDSMLTVSRLALRIIDSPSDPLLSLGKMHWFGMSRSQSPRDLTVMQPRGAFGCTRVCMCMYTHTHAHRDARCCLSLSLGTHRKSPYKHPYEICAFCCCLLAEMGNEIL